MRIVSLSLCSSAALLLTLAGEVGCGDSGETGGSGGAGTTTATSATSTTGKGATGSGTTNASSSAAGTTSSTGTGGLVCSGATPVALTVKNYLNWCTVTVDGNAPSGASQTVCVAAGAVNVSATANPGFELGLTPWHHVVGDSGSGALGVVTGNPPSSAAVVTAAAPSTCAWICCETTGFTDCPTTDLCP